MSRGSMRERAKATFIYGAMIAAAVALFFVIRNRGEMLIAPAPPPGGSVPVAQAAPDVLWHLLLALATVVTVGRLLGAMFRYIGQPPVIGEVVGGILLGPSFLGLFAPEAYRYVLPST